MRDPLDDVLGLVADGRLTPEEAAPIIDALARARETVARAGNGRRQAGQAPAGPPPPPGSSRRLHIEVRDGGRTTVDLQLPGVLAELAGAVPGIPAAYVDRIREALRTGVRGPVVEVNDEDGSGVTISVD